MGFILLLDNQKSWIIDDAYFEKFLKTNYSVSTFSKIDNIDRPYSYEWKTEEPTIEGFLHKDGDSIHIDGELDDCFRFVIELRKIIPEENRLLFFDSSYNYQAIIEINTSFNNLKEVFI